MKFTVNEKDLSKGLLTGATMLERVRLAREKLTDGIDFIHSDLGVMYSREGVKKMVDFLKIEQEKEPKDATPQPTKNTAETLLKNVSRKLEKRKVSKLSPYPGNRKYMGAVDVQTGDKINVHVRDNVNFTSEMVIEVVQGFGGAWDYVGPMPRSRGRW